MAEVSSTGQTTGAVTDPATDPTVEAVSIDTGDPATSEGAAKTATTSAEAAPEMDAFNQAFNEAYGGEYEGALDISFDRALAQFEENKQNRLDRIATQTNYAEGIAQGLSLREMDEYAKSQGTTPGYTEKAITDKGGVEGNLRIEESETSVSSALMLENSEELVAENDEEGKEEPYYGDEEAINMNFEASDATNVKT